MPGVADILRRHGEEYLKRYAKKMLPSHKRAIQAILSCRTEAMGGQVWRCSSCASFVYSYHSCRHRACPKCQGKQTDQWYAAREKELANAACFHLVFTVPKQLRRMFRSNQRVLYTVLMKAAIEATQELARDGHYLGGEIAVLAVLHTWTRVLAYHPHVHLLVPAIGLNADGQLVRARQSFFLPVKALSKLFRGKLRAMAEQELGKRLPWVEQQEWVVYCKPAASRGRRVLRYLSRYMFRQAITNSRILHLGDDGSVTFKYKDGTTGQWKQMTIPAVEFLRRYLQHVLPKGLHKVRYAGLWHPLRREQLQRMNELADAEASQNDGESPAPTAKQAPRPLRCAKCGCTKLIHLGELRRGQLFEISPKRPPPPQVRAA